MTKPIKFGIIGGGWRTTFFLQIARELPERFQVGGLLAGNAGAPQRIGVAQYSSVSGNATGTRPRRAHLLTAVDQSRSKDPGCRTVPVPAASRCTSSHNEFRKARNNHSGTNFSVTWLSRCEPDAQVL